MSTVSQESPGEEQLIVAHSRVSSRWTVLVICLFLGTITWAVFGQTLHYGFVNYDDDTYVYENEIVQKGLSLDGLRWAFSFGEVGHWHPLTWLSHMFDCQIYGLNAGGHHLTNLLLHTASAILLFFLLRQMTGFLWRSAFVSAVFAVHPLRVESVAWIAERKDVLGTFFFMLTVGAYISHVRRPSSWVRYITTVVLLAVGLLAKNMLVTVPFILLLLDYWPLNRCADFSIQTMRRLVTEKIPFFVLSTVSCIATFLVPEKVDAATLLPFALRVQNALISYVTYLWQMVWPVGLTCLYPNPTAPLPLWQVISSLALLLAVSVCFLARRAQHYLIIGWLWYLGMLVPVIGIVQISYYAHADRYTYLPHIGLYVLLTWLAVDLSARWWQRRWILGGLATCILAALIFFAQAQVAYWRSDEALWSHALECTTGNAVAHNNMAVLLLRKEQPSAAVTHARQAVAIWPDYAKAHYNLGNALRQIDQPALAIASFQQAVSILPGYAKARYNLGVTLLEQGKPDAAVAQLQQVVKNEPKWVEACTGLANALMEKGQYEAAIERYVKISQMQPDAAAFSNLGNALVRIGRPEEALAACQKPLALDPKHAEAHNNLGNALLRLGKAAEAIASYQKAIAIRPEYAEVHYNLGVAYLKLGQLDAAIVSCQAALKIKPDYADAHYNLAILKVQQAQAGDAIAHYREAVFYNPEHVYALNNLAWLLSTSPDALLRDGTKAISLALRAIQGPGGKTPIFLHTLAAAYAETGQFQQAAQTAQQAADLASDQGNAALAEVIQAERRKYLSGIPVRDSY